MKYFFLKLLINAVGVVISSYLLTGVHVENFGYAIIIALTLALLNVSIKPLLILFTLPATLLSLGLFLLVINASIIMIADWIVKDGFRVDSFWWALGFSILLSLLSSIIERIVQPAKLFEKKEMEDKVKIYDKDGHRVG